MMKNEENERRKIISLADDDFQVISKRRRREPAAAALISEDNQTQKQQVCQNSTTSTTKRSSRFRGVSRHRWTGRYEAHLWDKLSWNMTQKKKGKQGGVTPLHCCQIQKVGICSISSMLQCYSAAITTI